MPELVRAAGAVLHRGPGHDRRFCVVHRPRYDDWSLPKGKLDHDEHPLVGALREVAEETGVQARPEQFLEQIAYPLPDGTPKVVDFWLMRASDGPAGPVTDTDEVDRVEWLSAGAAAGRLTYPDDQRLVRQAGALPPITATVPLVRHAHAGDRKSWKGHDGVRPLDDRGWAQATGLAEVLAAFRPERLFAATPLRCKQTLEPLADKTGLPIVTDSAFAEPAHPRETPARVAAALARLGELHAGVPTVICSQGKLIPPMLAALTGDGEPGGHKTPKGGGWVLSYAGPRLVSLTRL